MLNSIEYTIIMSTIILLTVFAWNITEGWLPPKYDVFVEYFITGSFFLFSLELVLIIISIDKWWKTMSFWIYLIATIVMVLDSHWLKGKLLFYPVVDSSRIASLRLFRFFRIFTRIGRLIRIIKVLLMNRFKVYLANILKREKDEENLMAIKKARKQLVNSGKHKAWKSLEVITSVSITAIVSIIFIIGVIFLESIECDRSAERTFDILSRLENDTLAAEIRIFEQNFPYMLYLRIRGKTYLDSIVLADGLQAHEVLKYSNDNNELWLNIQDSVRLEAKRYALFTMMLVIVIASIIAIFNWIINRFSFELSGK